MGARRLCGCRWRDSCSIFKAVCGDEYDSLEMDGLVSEECWDKLLRK